MSAEDQGREAMAWMRGLLAQLYTETPAHPP